jgi:hypothetical protein
MAMTCLALNPKDETYQLLEDICRTKVSSRVQGAEGMEID